MQFIVPQVVQLKLTRPLEQQLNGVWYYNSTMYSDTTGVWYGNLTS